MILDFNYMLFVLLPGMLLAMWAQSRVKNAYARASRIASRRGCTGAEVARMILEAEGIRDVKVEPTHGFLSDHYHPLQKTLRLSEGNFSGTSLAAAGIATHEVGHAIQHARGYFPLMIRSAMVPACQVGSWIGQAALLFGVLLLFMMPALGQVVLFWGILGYSAVLLFTLVTLPVEFNASSRALAVLEGYGILDGGELKEARSVLNAAALTYVASAAQVLLVLLYMISLYRRN